MNQIFQLNELGFTYSDKKELKQIENNFELKDISFNIDCGDFVSVIGRPLGRPRPKKNRKA